MNEDFDYVATLELIQALVPADESVSRKMRALIAVCEAQHPHDDWAAFHELPFDQEAPKLTRWLRGKFEGTKPGRPVRALWFGLYNPISETHGVVADFDVCGSSSYDPEDDTFDWASDPDYLPQGPNAGSEVLAELYGHAYATADSLGNLAEYPLALGYTAFAIAEVFRGISEIPVVSEDLAIAVGFNSGDGLLVGRWTPRGFVPADHTP